MPAEVVKESGSEHWQAVYQNYHAFGWLSRYKPPDKDNPNKIILLYDVNNKPYICFNLVTPILTRKKYAYLTCKAWGTLAKFMAKYLQYGDPVIMTGYADEERIELDSFNGKKRKRKWQFFVATAMKSLPFALTTDEIKAKKFRKDADSDGRINPLRDLHEFAESTKKRGSAPWEEE